MSNPPNPLPRYVYKVFPASDVRYTDFQIPVPSSHVFFESPLDAQDGFIHLSTSEQLPGVLERFFNNEASVGVIKLLYGRLSAFKIVKWEQAGQNGVFPHLYGQLTGEFVDSVKYIDRKKEETWTDVIGRLESDGWVQA